MNQSEFRGFHLREAARLRSLVANATTPALKARLLEEAENHELLALGERQQLSGSLPSEGVSEHSEQAGRSRYD
jgi:hypothetical protein